MRTIRPLLTALLIGGLAAIASAQSGYLSVTPYPTMGVADGHSTLTVTAFVTTTNGQPVPDGTQILFQSDLGTFREALVATKDGYARDVLVSGTITGTASIKVKVLGLPIPPQNAEVEFLGDRSLLSSAKEYVEIDSPTLLKYSPIDRMIEAEAAKQGVSIRYRDIEIQADVIQLDIPTYELRALRAKVKIGKSVHEFRELNLKLNNRKGTGLTDYTAKEVDGLIGAGRFFIMKTVSVEKFGLVDIVGSNVKPAKDRYIPESYTMKDFSDAPALISAKKAFVFPHKEIQFQRAELIVGDSKVMKLPLFRAPLNGNTPVFTDQIVNVNDNQLAVSYPYYLSLKPGETSFLRFHMGDHTNGFAGGNGPQMDYEWDWNHGDDMDGGLLISGLGQSSWGIGLHQSYRFDDRTNGYAQLQMPALHSVFGSMGANHQFDGYSLSLNSNLTRTLQGVPLNDEQTSLSLERDPVRVGKLPLRFSYGLAAVHATTSAPIAVAQQESIGLDARFQLEPRQIDKLTSFNASLTFSQLQGRGVTGGIGTAATMTLSRRLSRDASMLLTYDFTQNALEGLRLGSHRLSGQGFYARGNASLIVSGSMGLDIDRLDYSALTSYQFAKQWRLGYGYTYDRFLGSTYLDYNMALYYRIAGRDIGLTYSRLTKRLGIQVLGATIN